MEESEIMKKILEDEDFINSKKFNNSLAKMLDKLPEKGLEDNVIAKVLMISEEEVRQLYEESIKTLKKQLANKE